MSKNKLRIIPLGGLGEVGKNMMVYEYGKNILIVDAGLKSQIVAAVHRRYYKTLEDDEFGLTDISTRDILAHLTSKYAKLTADDLEKNRNELSKMP